MDKDDDNLWAFIPDFIYDFIGRIIPGLIVISLYLYWTGKGLECFHHTFEISLFILVAAWVIGVTLDEGVFFFWKLFRKSVFPGDDPLPRWESEPASLVKHKGLGIFYRSMAVICGVTISLSLSMIFLSFLTTSPPDVNDDCVEHLLSDLLSALTTWLPVLNSHDVIYLVLASVLFVVYVFGHIRQRPYFLLNSPMPLWIVWHSHSAEDGFSIVAARTDEEAKGFVKRELKRIENGHVQRIAGAFFHTDVPCFLAQE